MSTKSFELTRLDTATFEHLVNSLAIRVIGKGATGFAAGSDAGRDGYYEGEAEYPSKEDRWNGVWYVQSKFHAPSLGGNPQKWLQNEVTKELKEFARPDSKRILPDNWIIATNIDPSATPETGTFDVVRSAVKNLDPELAKRTHIWGGKKIIDFLTMYPEVQRHYGGLLTSGDVISKIIDRLSDDNADVDGLLRNIIVTQLYEQQYTKLEQAGSSSDTRPGIQTLYTDLPYYFKEERYDKILGDITKSVAEIHNQELPDPDGPTWKNWRKDPTRSRIYFVRGGPGHGKSTVTQYLCQIQRSALLISSIGKIPSNQKTIELAKEIKEKAEASGLWPLSPRVPIHIELRLYAHWYGENFNKSRRGILSYLSDRFSIDLEQNLSVGTIKRALGKGRWLVVFDGLDEVPGDVKDSLAREIKKFVDDVLVECKSDVITVCTSRPQGYSGQFDELDPTVIDLAKLQPEEALSCADPILCIDRPKDEIDAYRLTLGEAIKSPSIQEIMTTPLQSHIMAVVVRDGGRPPERRWQLFTNFYQVIKKREANRNLPDPKIAGLLREKDELIKSLHNRLGFELHYRAEKSSGAQTSISREELRKIIMEVVTNLQDDDVDSTVALLAEATTERLVLVNTPESGETVRFDIRPLQEFFAAEYIYESAGKQFLERLRAIAPDSHWREVMHFLLSALVAQGRRSELSQAVEVLAGLDDSPIDDRRAISRRLSIGGIISLRLLHEGVIESDKRVRELFRKCLMPLMSVTDAGSQLTTPPPQHSRNWLAGVALDSITEQASYESIGAACLLPTILSDDSPHRDKAINNLLFCDEVYFDVFISSWSTNHRNRSKGTLPKWTLEAILRRLIEKNWKNLGEETLQKTYEILADHRDSLSEAAIAIGMPDKAAHALKAFFIKRRPNYNKGSAEKNYGGLIKEVFSSEKEFDRNLFDEEVFRDHSKFGGVFKMCALLMRGSLDRCSSSIRILDAELGGVKGLSLLPSRFRDMFIDRIAFKNSADINNVIDHDHAGLAKDYLIEENDDQINWPNVFNIFPHLHSYYLFDKHERRISQSLEVWLQDDNNRDFFVRTVISNADRGSLQFGDLGHFIKMFPESSKKIKNAVASANPPADSYYFGRQISSFPLSFPDDVHLLPHLVNFLCQQHHHLISNSTEDSDGSMSGLVKEYIVDSASLKEIWLNHTLDDDVVAAAGCLLASVDPYYFKDPAMISRLVELYDPKYSRWFLLGILTIISPLVVREEPFARDIADRILKEAQRDLAARFHAEGSISGWREISRAPVNATYSTKIWQSDDEL